MPDNKFGPLLSFHDVEFALIGHVKTWLETFLSARERKVAITAGQTKRPRSYIARQTFNILPGETATPLICVVSNGTVDDPNRHGEGTYDVELRMAVVALCHGNEATVARRIAGHYQAALLDLLLKRKRFVLFNNTPCTLHRWLGIALDDIDESQVRTLCSARLEFTVMVRDFAQSFGGPTAVPADPRIAQPDYPTVQTTQTPTEPLV